MCPYAYYGKLENYNRDIILCKKQDNKMCSFTRYCNKKNMMIPNDRFGYTMEDCKMRYEVEIPKGSSRVRKTVSDSKFLYVDIEIKGNLYTHKLKNPYPNGEIPDYVYVQEGLDGYEIVDKERKNTRNTRR